MPQQATCTWRALCVVLSACCALWPAAVVKAQEQSKEMVQHLEPSTDVAPTVLTLDQAIEWALTSNPMLQAGVQKQLAINAEGQQFSVRPNPELELEFEEFGGSGDYSGSQNLQSTLSVSQLIELGSKRTRRQTVASQQDRVAQQQLIALQTSVMQQTHERFMLVQVAQQQLTLAQRQLDQAKAVMASVRKGIAAGKKAPLEELRFSSLVTQAQLRYDAARTNLTSQRQILASTWQGQDKAFSAVAGPTDTLAPLPTLAWLQQQIGQAPAVAVALEQQQLALEQLALERAKGVQDVSVSLGVKNDRSNDDMALMAGLSVPLGVFDRNRAGISAAENRTKQWACQVEDVEQTVWRQLVTLHRDAQQARQEAVALQTDLLPAAQAVFEAVSFGYEQGKYGVIDVLDAQGRWLESEDRYIAAVTRFHQQMIAIAAVLGLENKPRN